MAETTEDRARRNNTGQRVGVSGETQTIAVPMIGSAPVMIEGEFPLTEDAWTYFMAVLKAMKQGLVSDAKVDEDE